MTHPSTSATRFAVDLDGPGYVDRVYGCWQGKNAGGTLGTPLETAWGQDEPFDVWWYPELKEGGLPNDDLEMQLVWLKALEEVGPQITARDLARYWLDHIGYNFDEYGLSKLNLKWGLEPPVSGHHNNWFIDCMGSPIRSEIWACVAPGAPRLAARYAYQDAICDHAGGEGVYGELFNAALESAAFVVQEPHLLIDIALSYVPEDCMVRRAVEAARSAFDRGLGWREARREVMNATPHYNAQYSPINLGFQVIGLLYGHDFGEGICITVNCGYDTDSSGAAIGSYLGIIQGRAGLPQKWVAPLGAGISTNQNWGGVKHLDGLPNPVPDNLDDLIQRIRRASLRVLSYHGLLSGSILEVDLADLYADESVQALHEASPNVVLFPGQDVDVDIDYREGPVAVPDATKRIDTTIRNRRAEPLEVELHLSVPRGWQALPDVPVNIEPGGERTVAWELRAPRIGEVGTRNVSYLSTRVTGRPAAAALPIVLVGANALRLSQVYRAADGESVQDLLMLPLPPEEGVGDGEHPQDRPGAWRDFFAAGYEQPIADGFDAPGAIYLQTFAKSPDDRKVWIVVDPSCPIRYWVNGKEAGQNSEYRLIRPNQKAADGIGAFVHLHQGWNEVLVKLIHDGQHPRPQLHVGFSGSAPLNDHQFDLGRSCFPWSDGDE